MSEGSKIVSDAIIGNDFVTVMVANKMYAVMPPTIHKLAGAGLYLSGFGKEETLHDIIKSVNDSDKLSLALSWLINGNDSLSDELSRGSFDELVNALCEAYSLISVENFTKLSALAKNVARLIANQK